MSPTRLGIQSMRTKTKREINLRSLPHPACSTCLKNWAHADNNVVSRRSHGIQGFPLAGCVSLRSRLFNFFFQTLPRTNQSSWAIVAKTLIFLVSPRTAFNRSKETTGWRPLSHPLGPFSQVITLPNTAPRNIVASRLAQQSVLDRRRTFGSLLAFNDTVRIG